MSTGGGDPGRPVEPDGPVGRSQGRSDARAKCRGEATYLGDLVLPGMVHAKVLRSPVPHARITGIDTTAARSLPGLIEVVTAADLPSGGGRFGHILRDQPILARDVVRYVGEPVAIAIAADEATALEAVQRIGLELAPLPGIALDAALSPGSPLLHEEPVERGYVRNPMVDARIDGNRCYEYVDRRGDPEAALAAADVVVEHDYTFPSVYQYAMEPHGAIATWGQGRLTLWASCQHPFLVRRELAGLFGLDLDDVRIMVPFLGGGFGSKSYTTVEPLACLAALRAGGRPVRLVNDVEASMQTTRQHNMRCWMQTAATKDGRLLLRRARILMDTGAYATNGPTVTFMTGLAAPGPYSWSALDVRASCVYTTRPPAGSYRGFGSSHTQWISESQLDEIAGLAGLDRFELRRRNLLGRGGTVHPRLKPLDADLPAVFETLLAELPPQRPPARPGVRTGYGVGFAVVPAGADPVANALVKVRHDGRVTVLVGTTEIGQGARTVFAQIAAQALVVPFQSVTVPGADTASTPYDRSTGASRSTTLVGLAVQRACADLVVQLSGLAARALGADTSTVEYADGVFAAGDRRLLLADVLRQLGEAGDELIGRGRVGTGGDPADFPVFWEVCAAAAVVEVDESTGAVSVLKTLGVADVGKAINPLLVAVQDSGCTMQALGNTLLEELEFGPEGEMLTASLAHYHVPRAVDAPETMACVMVENGDGPGPFGAKGCGEGPFGAVPAAIVTALRDAGVHVRDLPATPERVWSSLPREAPSPAADTAPLAQHGSAR